MALVKVTYPEKIRDKRGNSIDSVRILIDWHENATIVHRYGALLQVSDYSKGSGDSLSITPSNTTQDTWTEGTDFNAQTDNATTANNIASAINGTIGYNAGSVDGHAWNPYVSIEYTGGGHIDNTSVVSDAWSYITINSGNGSIAKVASNDSGTRQNQPVFTDSNGKFTIFCDNRADIDLRLAKSGKTFDTAWTEDITLSGGTAFNTPASTTDHAIVRWDSTSGSAVLDSIATVDDSGNLNLQGNELQNSQIDGGDSTT